MRGRVACITHGCNNSVHARARTAQCGGRDLCAARVIHVGYCRELAQGRANGKTGAAHESAGFQNRRGRLARSGGMCYTFRRSAAMGG